MFSGKTAKLLQTISVHKSDVTSMDFYGSSVLVTGSSDKSVRVWKWEPGTGFVECSFSPLMGHKYGVTCVRVSPKGSVLASSSVDGRTILWNLNTGEKIGVLNQENGEAIRGCAFSPDGKFLISCDDTGSVNFFNQDFNMICATKDHEETVRTVSFSPDSRVLISGCVLGNLRLYQLDPSYKEKLTVDCSVDNAHDLGVLCSAFCKQVHTDCYDRGTKIYTLATSGMDHYIKLWRLFSVETVNEEERHMRSRLIPQTNEEHCCGGSTIYATRRMNMENILCYSAHGSSVTCLRFNESGTTLVSGSFDKTIKMWDLKGNCLITLLEHTRYINCIAINSMILASGSNDRTVMIWDLTGKSSLDTPIADVTSSLFRLASSQEDVPVEMVCSITHEIMTNPVIAEDGFTYEEDAIKEWFSMGKNTSPMTNLPLTALDYIPNAKLRQQIEEYLLSFDEE